MGNVKSINGLAFASMKSRNGLARASIKTINGLAAPAGVTPFGGAVDVTNLVAWWPLSEASGTRVDVHAGLDLTDNNTVTGGNDGVAYSQFTVANSEYLSIADNAALSTGNVDFAWCGWVYLDSKTTHRVLAIKGTNLNDTDYEFIVWYRVTNDMFQFTVSNGTAGASAVATALGSPSLATWYFIVCAHNAGLDQLEIQVNNGTINTTGYSTGSWDSALPFELGRGGSAGGLHHAGRMRRIGFWKRILTAGEKTALYGAGAGLDY